MALLPKETNNPADFIAALPENALADMIHGAVEERVVVTIPAFSFDDVLDIKQMLRKEGIQSVFDANKADISNMVTLPKSYVADIKHKSHIVVDRNGTKAAAATMLACCAFGVPPMPRFEVKLNRPFVFAIVHNESGLPLFLGVVNTLKGIE
jgi:serpin B